MKYIFHFDRLDKLILSRVQCYPVHVQKAVAWAEDFLEIERAEALQRINEWDGEKFVVEDNMIRPLSNGGDV